MAELTASTQSPSHTMKFPSVLFRQKQDSAKPFDETTTENAPAQSSTDENSGLLGAEIGDTTAVEGMTEFKPSADSSTPDDESREKKRVAQTLEGLHSMMHQLAKDFELKLKYDASKQSQIDKLYDENRAFKEDVIRKFQNSLVMAVIEQIDEAAKQITFFENTEYSEALFKKLLRSYRDIATGFQDMLAEKFDVEFYRCDPDTPFDPKKQRSLKTAPTDDSEKNKLVKQSLRPGYAASEGLILRPEFVEVYLFDPKKNTTPDTIG